MTNKQFKIVTESEHFIYFVTEEDENINWCLKIAVKEKFVHLFNNVSVDEISGYKIILKIKLGLRYQPNYMRLDSYNDSPYKMRDLEREYKNEIKKTIIKSNTIYVNEKIPYYDYALVLWEELNDKEKFYSYETPNQEQRWFNTWIEKEYSGLAMNIELVVLPMGKVENVPPYIIIQNDYETKHNLNWVRMRLDGTILEDKKLIFSDDEIQDIKKWIEINKLPILLCWTQEVIYSSDIAELTKPIKKKE